MDGFYRQPGVIEKQVGIGHFYFLRQGFDILIMDLQFAIQRCPYLPLQFKSAVFHHPGSYRVILFIFRITDDNGHAILQAGETSPHRKPVMTGTAGAAQEQRRGIEENFIHKTIFKLILLPGIPTTTHTHQDVQSLSPPIDTFIISENLTIPDGLNTQQTIGIFRSCPEITELSDLPQI